MNTTSNSIMLPTPGYRDPEVLHLVNIARAAQALWPISSMPRGVRAESRFCPLKRAMNAVIVGGTVAQFWSRNEALVISEAWGVAPDGDIVSLPAPLRRFVSLFDAGLYPELEETAP